MAVMKRGVVSFLRMNLSLLALLADMSSVLYAAQPSVETKHKKPGFYTEDFRIVPEVETSLYYDDNVYAAKRMREADWIALISPRLGIDSLWKTNRFDIDGGADLGRYAENGSEDYDDYWLNGSAEIELSGNRQIYTFAGYNHSHESRDSKEADSEQTGEPTTYDLFSAQAGVNQKFSFTSIKAGLTYKCLDYDSVDTLYNDDRDRAESGVGVRMSYALSQQVNLFTQAIINQRDYEDRADQFGYDKDSHGGNFIIGASRRYGEGGKLKGFLGIINQDYDDARFADVSEMIFGVDLQWYPLSGTKLTAKAERTQNETTEVAASSYLYTDVDLQIDQKLSRDVLGYLNFNRGVAEFQDVGREDVSQSLVAGLKYYHNPWVMVSGSYSYFMNDSNDVNHVYGVSESYDYRRNVLFLSLRIRLVP